MCRLFILRKPSKWKLTWQKSQNKCQHDQLFGPKCVSVWKEPKVACKMKERKKECGDVTLGTDYDIIRQ